jgi:hypothetical protein
LEDRCDLRSKTSERVLRFSASLFNNILLLRCDLCSKTSERVLRFSTSLFNNIYCL